MWCGYGRVVWNNLGLSGGGTVSGFRVRARVRVRVTSHRRRG